MTPFHSSSSTLSPLAPPFTVVPPSPSDFPPDLRSQPFPSFLPGGNFEPTPDYRGTEYNRPGVWRRPYDADVPRRSRFDSPAPWTESPSFRGSERHSTFEDHPYGGWNGAYDNYWPRSGHFGSGSSEWLQNEQIGNYRHDIYSPCNSSAPYLEPSTSFEKTFYSSVPNVTSGLESSTSYAQKSSYDEYIAKFDSCSADQLAFHPITSRTMSTQAYASPRDGASSTMTTMPKQGVHHRVVVMKPGTKKNSDARVHDDEKHDNDLKKNIGASAVTEKVLLTGPPQDFDSSTKLNTALKIKSLIPASTSSTSGAMELDNSLKYSADADSVDSPCWRGAASSWKSPFAVRKTVNVGSVAVDPKNAGNAGPAKESLSKVLGSSNMLKEGRKTSAKSSSVISSSMLRKPEASNECGFDRKNEIVCPDGTAEKTEMEEEERCLELKEAGIHQMEIRAVNKIQIADVISDGTKDSDPSPNKNFKSLAKGILNVSVDLLCAEFDVPELEGDAFMPLIAARNNIDLILKDKKRPSLGTGDESDLKEFGGQNVHFRSINQMTKTLEDLMTKTSAEKEENVEAVLYKNLWLEAEASNCKLKYELKLALAKVKMESCNPFPPGKPPNCSVSSEKSFQMLSASHWNEKESTVPLVQSSFQQSKMIECGNLDAVAAHYEALEDLAGNNSTWGKNEVGLPNHESKSSSEARESVYGPMAVDANNSDLHDSATLAALGFTETTAGLYGREKIWTPPVNRKPLNATGAEYNNNLRSNLSNFDNARLDHLDGLPLYRTIRKGNGSVAAEYESPSCGEWEHVLGEELK